MTILIIPCEHGHHYHPSRPDHVLRSQLDAGLPKNCGFFVSVELLHRWPGMRHIDLKDWTGHFNPWQILEFFDPSEFGLERQQRRCSNQYILDHCRTGQMHDMVLMQTLQVGGIASVVDGVFQTDGIYQFIIACLLDFLYIYSKSIKKWYHYDYVYVYYIYYITILYYIYTYIYIIINIFMQILLM